MPRAKKAPKILDTQIVCPTCSSVVNIRALPGNVQSKEQYQYCPNNHRVKVN